MTLIATSDLDRQNIPKSVCSLRQNFGRRIVVGTMPAKMTMNLQVINVRYYKIGKLRQCYPFVSRKSVLSYPSKMVLEFSLRRIRWIVSRQFGLRSYPGKPVVSISSQSETSRNGFRMKFIEKKIRSMYTVNDLNNTILSALNEFNEEYQIKLITIIEDVMYEVINKSRGVAHH